MLFRRLDGALAAESAGPTARRRSAAIRWEVSLNLVLGVFIVFFVRLGGTA